MLYQLEGPVGKRGRPGGGATPLSAGREGGVRAVPHPALSGSPAWSRLVAQSKTRRCNRGAWISF